MSRSIIVAGNCQIGAIAAALQRIFPDDQVSAVPFNPNVFKGDGGALSRQLAAADIVLGSAPVGALLRRAGQQPRQFVTVPGLYFSAFHPDIVAAAAPKAGRRFAYNSGICVWAYTRGLDPQDAERLFTRQNLAALGYFHRWDASVQVLKQAFIKAGVEFDRFFLAGKREGAFMYTVNHPKASVLTWLAKLLAMQIGADASLWRREILVTDALARVEIWPVYPDVARELALPGSWSWVVDRGRVIEGLRAYIEYAYAKYAAAGVEPSDLCMVGAGATGYDAVLAPALGRP